MRVKDIMPYIGDRVVIINNACNEVARIFRDGEKIAEYPRSSYHEWQDSKVIEISSGLVGIILEVE